LLELRLQFRVRRPTTKVRYRSKRPLEKTDSALGFADVGNLEFGTLIDIASTDTY
jgi:hypothetical protein